MIISLPIVLLYGIFAVSGLFFIWGKRKEPISVKLPDGVSVIVAVKNESENLDRLIDSILKNKITIPYELIIVDDSSSDDSWALLEGWRLKTSKIQIYKNEGAGKKSAVKMAIEHSKYETIIQTDGDCEVSPFWLLSNVTKLIDSKTKLVIGPVYPFTSKGALNGFIRLEWLALQFLTAYTSRLNKPSMVNGANMTFYKTDYLAFAKSGLGSKYASGDDAFFLKYLEKYKEGSVFNLDQNSVVKTVMPLTFSGLLKQRIRWATKAGKTTNFIGSVFSLIVVLANFSWIGAIYGTLDDIHLLPVLIISVGWKLTTDFIICWNMSMFFKDGKVLRYVPVMFFIYPVYLLFGLVLSFKKTYSWKGVKMK